MGAALKPQAPAIGTMALYCCMLVTITSAPELVAGRLIVCFEEVTNPRCVPVGDEIPEGEWFDLELIPGHLADAIRRAARGASAYSSAG